MTERYTIISSDCHAGGNHQQYREYLEKKYHDDFDAWRGKYKNPFRDLQDDGRSRNWDNERRVKDLYADGVVAEIVFPNTVPPFFPTGVVIAPAPRPEDFELRLAGIRAHNRWLADFVADYPDQRVGLAQIFLNDLDIACEDIRWCRDHGIRGVLLPGVAPDTPWIEPLFHPRYDQLWALCEELDMPATHHSGGSAVPAYPNTPASTLIYVMEVSFFGNRALWHLMLSGVFERFPRLKFVLTEQGSGWVPAALRQMDGHYQALKGGRIGELGVSSELSFSMSPTEYFKRNVWIGASFASPSDAQVFRKIGIDRFMWGSDYPHNEASSPFSKESLRRTFSDWQPGDLRKVLSENAASVYGLDLAKLAPLGAQHGPTVDEIAVPLDKIPVGATSPTFFRD